MVNTVNIMTMKEYILSASYGNDSIALIQWAYEQGLKDVAVLYCDTGWAAPYWNKRVEEAEAWVESLGYTAHRTESDGFVALAKRKKAWPYNGAQFCTKELKIKPALDWMEEYDPVKDAVVMIGIRRAESRHRATHAEWTYDSENHGGRDLHAPLVRHTDADRDKLLAATPFEALPHRSMECYPCINANRSDLKQLDESRVAEIEALETEMGFTRNNKPRTLFRPHRHLGAVGIREVMNWAWKKEGKDWSKGSGCDSGWCDV